MRAAILVLLGGCSIGFGSQSERYASPSVGGWCNVAPGAYAYVKTPSTVPPLVRGCRQEVPPTTTSPTTLEEIIVEPGTRVEMPVALPPELRDAGCMLDSVVFVHGRSNDGFSIDVRVQEVVTPVITYARVPGMYAQRVHDRIPRDMDMYAVRHRLDIAAPPEFAIVLRGDKRFSIVVRSDAESRDQTLVIDGKDSHLVPMAALVISHCRLPARDALDTIQRKSTAASAGN